MDRIDEILHFWFDDLEADSPIPEEQVRFWFHENEETDRIIRQRFQMDWLQAAADDLRDWEKTPRGCLSLIILLDQFSRNLFRESAQAFTQDDKALELSLRLINEGQDLSFNPIERAFIYLPLEHSEDLSIQRRSVREFKKLLHTVAPELKETFAEFLDYAVRHKRVIERFGRFPHRNAVLGRASTREEEEFLAGPESPF